MFKSPSFMNAMDPRGFRILELYYIADFGFALVDSGFLLVDYEILASELAFLTADIFASFGVLPLLHLRAYRLQDATVYT